MQPDAVTHGSPTSDLRMLLMTQAIQVKPIDEPSIVGIRDDHLRPADAEAV
jgi:hypothetical protein